MIYVFLCLFSFFKLVYNLFGPILQIGIKNQHNAISKRFGPQPLGALKASKHVLSLVG